MPSVLLVMPGLLRDSRHACSVQHTGVKEKRQQRRIANHGLRMWKVAAEADVAFCTQVCSCSLHARGIDDLELPELHGAKSAQLIVDVDGRSTKSYTRLAVARLMAVTPAGGRCGVNTARGGSSGSGTLVRPWSTAAFRTAPQQWCSWPFSIPEYALARDADQPSL